MVARTDRASVTSEWKERLARGRDDLKRMIDGVIGSVRDPSAEALRFQNMLSFEEDRFYSTLEELKVGDLVDEMIRLRNDLATYIVILDRKWQAMNGENRYLEEAEKVATQQMTEMVDRAIAQSMPAFNRLERASARFVEEVKSAQKDLNQFAADLLKEMGVPGKAADMVKLLEPGKKLLGAWKSKLSSEQKQMVDAAWDALKEYGPFLEGKFTERVYAYKGSMARQTDGILVLFSQTRKDTDEFIRKNGFEAAKQRYEGSRSALESWASALPTDGLRSDASPFVQALLGSLSNQLELMETLFNQFVSQNRGRFFGPVGPDIEQALLETRSWEDTEARLREKGLESRLRQWRSDANKFLEVDVRAAMQSLDYNLREMPKEMRSEVTTFLDAVRDEVMRETRRRLEEMNRSFDATLQVAGDDKIKQALDRSQVRAALMR